MEWGRDELDGVGTKSFLLMHFQKLSEATCSRVPGQATAKIESGVDFYDVTEAGVCV